MSRSALSRTPRPWCDPRALRARPFLIYGPEPVKVLLQFLRRESVWPLLVTVIAAAVLLPRLDGYGFWEPHEIRRADQAHERLEAEAEAGDEAAVEAQGAERDRSRLDARAPSGPPFSDWIMAQGMRLAGGDKELGARLPLALLGLLTVVVTFFLGRRLASPRAGLLAALVLLGFPLLVLQSRQLMSNMGAALGSALTVLGLVGLAWPTAQRDRSPPWRYAADLALVVAGAVISYYAAALLLGVAVPFGAVGLACMAGLAATGTPEQRAGTRRVPLALGLALLIAGLGSALVTDALGMGRPARLGLGVLPALVGALLFARGIMSRRVVVAASPTLRRRRAHLAVVATVSTAVAVVALGWVLAGIFDLRPPIPGERALLGYSVVPAGDYVSALGGAWRLRDDLRATFDVLFEQIAYGMYPWSVLAPIALVHLAMGPRRGRCTWAGVVPLAWAFLAWVTASVMVRKVGPVQYPALVAVAVGVGMWLDHLLSAREQADATSDSDTEASRCFGLPLRLPLVALFVASAAMVLGKDIQNFPDRVTSLNALETIQYPEDMTVLRVFWLVLGMLFGVSMAGGLWLWERHRRRQASRPPWYPLGRHGVHAAVGIGLVFALFLVHGWIPALSHKLSSKSLYAAYDELRAGQEPLGVMGNPGSGLTYYAGDDYERLRNRNALLDFLGRTERVFALMPASELCALHRAAKGRHDYHVLDNSHAKFLLLSNRIADGERDRNPLAEAIVREPPEGIQRPLKVNYDGRIELVGVDMPEVVDRGDTFEMTLYFRVLRPLGTTWKIFLHFDGGGMRFQGDHEPIDGRCATTYWQAGDYIVDTVQVEAGNVTYPKTDYTLYVGFFRGSHGNWKNMPVERAETATGEPLPAEPNHRVNIGTLRVR